MEDKEILNKIKKLIKKEEDEALNSFTQSNFSIRLQKKIKSQSHQKVNYSNIFRRPVFVLSMALFVIIIGTLIIVNTPSLSLDNNDLNRIKKIFYTISESQIDSKNDQTTILHLSQEEIHTYELTWIFKKALYNLQPRKLSKQYLEDIFVRAFTHHPRTEKEKAHLWPDNPVQLKLEQRLRDLIKKKIMINILNKLSEKPEEV